MQVKGWEKRLAEFKPNYKTLLPKILGRHCREWPAGKADEEIKMLAKAISNLPSHITS